MTIHRIGLGENTGTTTRTDIKQKDRKWNVLEPKGYTLKFSDLVFPPHPNSVAHPTGRTLGSSPVVYNLLMKSWITVDSSKIIKRYTILVGNRT